LVLNAFEDTKQDQENAHTEQYLCLSFLIEQKLNLEISSKCRWWRKINV